MLQSSNCDLFAAYWHVYSHFSHASHEEERFT
jgi:hypothetical protein